jgi:RNA polymerase sigma-70 factor, ECF subfamily
VTKESTERLHEALTDLTRTHAGRILAILARGLNDLDLADEAVQDALLEATRTWPERGVPDNPPAWLLSVARRKAIDRQRRASSARRRTHNVAPALVAAQSDQHPDDDLTRTHMITDSAQLSDESVLADADDDQLRLVLLCCHPALDQDAQVALTLRLVGGLTTQEIASAFLIPEATLAQRIVRAKRKIRDAQIPLNLPARIDDRLDPVLTVLYLIFNEGYLARNNQSEVLRLELVDEAIRLTRLVASLVTHSGEPEGLLALELFHRSRVATRTNSVGELVLLDEQDRSKWDLAVIAEGNRIVAMMMAKRQPGPYQVQALIAAIHANARTAAETNWPMIVSLYAQLRAMSPSPVVALNHAVAVAMVDGPQAGLTLMELLDDLHKYHLWHAARGELLHRAGRPAEAIQSLRSSLELTQNSAEQRHLQRRIDEVTAGLHEQNNAVTER